MTDSAIEAERLALAVEAARIGVWDWDLVRNRFVYSDIARAICGFAPDGEVTYGMVSELVHPVDRPVTQAQLSRAVDPALREDAPYEYRIVRPDGEVRWVLAHGRAVFADERPQARAVRYVGSLQDITERRQLEHQAQSAADRLRLAMAAGALGSFEFDLRSGTIRWDAVQCAIFGINPARQPKDLDDVWRLVHPDDRLRLAEAAERGLADGSPYTGEFRIVRPDGEIRWATGATAFSRDETGQISHVFGFTLDVTRSRRAEAELAEREAVLRSMFDAAKLFIGVVELTPEGFVYVMVNRATADFYGFAMGDGPIDARDSGLTEAEISQWRATMMAVWTSGQALTAEYEFQRGGGSAGWYVGTYTPLPLGPTGLPRLSFVVIDITDRRRAEEEQAILMREIDHRAKNALAVVQAVVQLTRDDDPERFRAAVRGRVSAVARAHRLLAASRWKGASLSRMLEEEFEGRRTRPGQVRLHGPEFTVSADAAQSIALVFHELADNARRFGAIGAEGGSLEVDWTIGADGWLNLEWREHLPPSRQGLEPPARLGFGLSLLEQTVERQLAGTWRLDWGLKGLVCRLRLPALEAERPQSAGDSAQPVAAADGKAALVVEDEALIALELMTYLRDMGFEAVSHCATTAEALAVLTSGLRPAVTILDINLGRETSISLAEALVKVRAPIIFCSGYETYEMPDRLQNVPRLLKPVSPAALGQAVAEARSRALDEGLGRPTKT